MKPLVYYCRWQGASLRLQGRDQTAVWGYLVFTDDTGQEVGQPFYFHLHNQQLTLAAKGSKQIPTADENSQIVILDDMGVVI